MRRGGNADIMAARACGMAMMGLHRLASAAIGAVILALAICGAEAETAGTWRLHGTLEGDARPLLCKDPETANLVVEVLGRAIQARAGGDADKAKSLFEVAAKLESEICLKPAADDIVILRCNLGDKSFGDTRISLAKISAPVKSNSSAGEQPFYAWTYATIEPAAGGSSARTPTKNGAQRRRRPMRRSSPPPTSCSGCSSGSTTLVSASSRSTGASATKRCKA